MTRHWSLAGREERRGSDRGSPASRALTDEDATRLVGCCDELARDGALWGTGMVRTGLHRVRGEEGERRTVPDWRMAGATAAADETAWTRGPGE